MNAIRKIWTTGLAALFWTAIPAFAADATVTVANVTAKQRYPWNGLVDIACVVTGVENETNELKFAVSAVMPDTGRVCNASRFWVVRDGADSTHRVVTANGDYRLLWDAAADLGPVSVTNLIVRVGCDAHGKVQLWEGGPCWAETNIGAETPEEYGLYFWWGDTVGYRREGNAWVASDGSASDFFFDSANIPTYGKSLPTLQSEGWITAEEVLAPEHDAAHVQWGGGWRMPTYQELYDLYCNKCDWTWTTQNGVAGSIVRGRGDFADASIFLPAAGYGIEVSLKRAGGYGYYWSSVPYSGIYDARCLYFGSGDRGMDHYYRYNGFSVRPVQGFAELSGGAAGGRAGDSAPIRLDTMPGTRIAREVETITYSTAWNGGASVRVTADGAVLKEAAAPASGDVAWNAAAAGVGCHVLRHESGGVAMEARLAVPGGDVVLHAGTVAGSETWAAGKVHLVTSAVAVPGGVTLTIEPGAIVKFMDGTGLAVADGGTCAAAGVVFTHVADDTAGGDTLMDGGAAVPVAGRYDISGNVADDDGTEYRYMPPQELPGSISNDMSLRGHRTYIVSNTVTVANGATLTLQPGTVFKFASGCSLTVNGSLDAKGTRAAPIVFTSVKDDEHGGDTNGDGTGTTPEMNDWGNVFVTGAANLEHVSILYAGGFSDEGALYIYYGGTATLSGCTVAHGQYDGIRHWGNVSAENTIIRDCARGVCANGGEGVFRNCVVDGCRWGIMAEGLLYWLDPMFEAKGFYTNCVITGFYYDPGAGVSFTETDLRLGYGVSLWYGGSLSVANCVVWSDKDGTMPFMDCGGTGCIEKNPLFLDSENGDFRIRGNSPCVDAGDGAAAPERDFYGRPRMDVSVVRDTGTAAANGNAPDIGIFEVDGDGDVPAPDLAVASVTAPATMTVGGTNTITWVVRNIGEEPASGSWRDEVEIVSANGQVFSMGTVATPSSTEISPGGSATFSAMMRVPAAPEGAVQVRVTANKHGDLFEAKSTANNAKSADATLGVQTISVPANGCAIAVPADADCGFALDGGSALATQGGVLVVRGAAALDSWLGNGSLAARDNALRTAVEVADDTWLLQIPAGAAPRVTIANGGNATATASLSLAIGGFLLLDTGKTTAANSDIISLPFAGNGFADGMNAWIERNGTRIAAEEVLVESEVSARALFDVSGCGTGDWTLCIEKDGISVSAVLLTLESPTGPAKFAGDVDILDTIRANRAYAGTFRYGNEGGMAMAAPYVRLEAKGGTLIRLGTSDAWTKSVEFLAASDTYPASILAPGASSSVTFFYMATGGDAEIEYACTLSSADPFPWSDAANDLRPSWASDELWGFAFSTLRRNFGGTWDSYLDRLRHDCDHLMKVGSPVKRLDRIWQLEINEALGNDAAMPQIASATDLARSARGLGLAFSRSCSSSLRGRFTSGILGYGWTDNFSSCVELLDSDTLVFHLPSGGSYSFTKATGEWKPQDARDKTQLTETDSAYVLEYASGTVQTFSKTTKKTSSIRDSVGNTLSFTYSGGNLARLTHSDGQSLTFTYSGGKLSKAQDDQGRTVSYAYNGEMLASVTAFNGLVTRYEYVSAPGTPRDKALSRIVYPDGATSEFEYDANGLLAATSANGGRLRTAIVRGGFGCHSIVAPNGGVTDMTVGASGETLKTVNARGEAVRQTYSADTLLESTISPSGRRSALTHDRDGNPVTASSASGATMTFSYEPDFGLLASVTDAKGHAFNYDYDELGRNVSVAYADGSEAIIEFDARGDMVRSTNRRGETVSFEYDGEGRLVKKTWPNGRTFTLAYDAKGNVTNASDSVTGTVTMEYDGNERMKRIVYPKNRGFAFTHDEAGRTISRTTLRSDGAHAVESTDTADIQRYSYDSFGRLLRVMDGDGNAWLENAYDPVTGWLATQTYGNGTVVSNAYDELGRTIGIYHGRANSPSEPWLAFFEYAYDEDGRCVSQTTAEGVERYSYDADGQLTGVFYPDGTSEKFAYDAMGNRTAYAVNELNQYLSGNGATFTYDADGNMTSRTDTDGTTTYAYDVLNRLVAVTNETKNIRWSCEYDVFGNRVSVTDNGTTTERLFVQGSLPSVAAEYVADSLAKRHILIGAVRVATGGAQFTVTDSSTRYYHADLLGSARLTTDGSGAAKGTRSFKAFGETRVSTGETPAAGYVGTLGIETDPTGLLFMRNRYYDAKLGRFVQMDPIGIRGEDANLYIYVGNSPIDNNDPSGCLLENNKYWKGIKTGLGGVSLASALTGVAAPVAAFTGCLYGAMTLLEKAEKSWTEPENYTWRDDAQVVIDMIGVAGGAAGAGKIDLASKVPGEVTKSIGKYTERGLSSINKGITGHGFRFSQTAKGISRHQKAGERILNSVIDFTEESYSAFSTGSDFADTVYLFSKESKLLPTDMICRVDSSSVQPEDPNEIVGTSGIGPNRYVERGDRLNYTVYFENKPEATAAAQEVTVVLPMDGNLDWTTLELGEVAFGDNIDMGLSGKKRGTSNYANPGTNTFVRTKVSVEKTGTGDVLKWYIRDWDPTTVDNFPEDARGGFLPPNVGKSGCGEGHVSFSVCVKADAPRGGTIAASANIQFDKNPWIETDPSWFNTVIPLSYTVKFNANGGTGTMADQSINRNATAKLRANAFKKSGCTFMGWSKTKTGKVAYSDKASVKNLAAAGGTVTLYAQWAKTKYKVAFNANGGTGKMAAQTMTYNKASKLRKNAFKRNGFTFMGWARSKTGAVAYANQASVKNLRTDGKTTTLYARWAKTKYTVAFNANGGTGKMAKQTMTYGKAAKLRKNAFKRSGWTFLGWAKTKTGAVAYKNAASVKNLRTDGKTATLYAKWAKNRYKVAFNANGGSGTMAAQTMTYGKAAKLKANAFKRTGYAFTGWAKTTSGAKAYSDRQSVKNLRTDGGTTTLYAKWTENSSTESVSGVPHDWLKEKASGILSVNGGDCEAATAAKAANGVNTVWECYVAGLDPTDGNAAFTAAIAFDADGNPVVSPDPDLGEERAYTVEGVENLGDAWGPTNAATRFFRMKVRLRDGDADAQQ